MTHDRRRASYGCTAVITPSSNPWGKWRVHYVWACGVITSDSAWTEAHARRKATKFLAKLPTHEKP